MAEHENKMDEVDVESLNILFAKDPLELTDNDVDRITENLRKSRELWAKKDAAGLTRKAAKPRKRKVELTSEINQEILTDIACNLDIQPAKVIVEVGTAGFLSLGESDDCNSRLSAY